MLVRSRNLETWQKAATSWTGMPKAEDTLRLSATPLGTRTTSDVLSG